MIKKALLLLASLLTSQALFATELDAACASRPVTSVYSLDVGVARVLDTYLTPITYDGAMVRLSYLRSQDMAWGAKSSDECRWTAHLDAGIEYADVENPSGNNSMDALLADLRWGATRIWRDVLTPRLDLRLGGATQLRGGAIYNSANSNNVVSPKIYWNVGVKAQASWLTHLGKTPLVLAYNLDMPLAGVFYASHYDQSFYEMYVGNHSGLARFGWWGNRFDMTNRLSADFHLGATVVRIGYRNTIETSWVNHINNRFITHTLTIGIGGNWLSVNKFAK